ncbi:MAG: hypothetical protein ACI3XC_02065 [Phascolarctobacterium sp.]
MTFLKQAQKVAEQDKATQFFMDTEGKEAPVINEQQNKKRTRRVSLLLTDSVFQKLEKVTSEKGVSKNAYIAMALDAYFKSEQQ